MALVPSGSGGRALDVGARDGWFSALLTQRFTSVVALDLEKPTIEHPGIECVQGDATDLAFCDNAFDLVLCTEVLEHIPSKNLLQACSEIQRVAQKYIIIGVPFKQDIRIGRTMCYTCGKRNPPWGHVNRFDELSLRKLFPLCDAQTTSFVGVNHSRTTALSTFLMDLAGNPYGVYDQEEPCIHCGARLKAPPPRNLTQKICTRLAIWMDNIQQPFHDPHPNWIHVLFQKKR